MPVPGIVHAARSDIGARRTRNEDALVIDESLGLYLVADGMGGHAHGDVASRIAVDAVKESMSGGESLEAAIRRANRSVLRESGPDAMYPMGTTVCGVHLFDQGFHVAWVGDSRAYYFRDRLIRLTTDHTYVQDLMLRGELDPKHARRHPYRNMLLQALGVTGQDELRVDVIDGELTPGSGLLLCTDGLTEDMADEVLEGIVARNPDDAEATADSLLTEALERGGSDNITLVWIWRPGNDHEES